MRLEEPETPATLGDVLDVAGRRVDQPLHLVDQLRDEGEADPGQRQPDQQVRDTDRRHSPDPRSALDPRHERVEREREQQRDEDPGENRLGQLEEVEEHEGGEDDREETDHGPDPELDIPRLHPG